MKNIAIFASGSGTNAQRIAEYFYGNADINVSIILTNRKDAYVLERAKNLNIESHYFTKEQLYQTGEVCNLLLQKKIDLIVLAGFLWLIPAEILRAFPRRIINIHPALLPKYGGAGMYGMKVHEAVKANHEIESGITIHYVNEKYDEGEIIFQARCAVSPGDSAEDIANKAHSLEYKYYPEIIEKVLNQF
jgi:phosphoribosylglycinamide formyltransferase-1